ncbi:MAG: DEAD/DEAH box helicase [Elusimicrobia bacterium]|nr:DEAD/DEAH box helicase [Elusimicrobiota bacterium]
MAPMKVSLSPDKNKVLVRCDYEDRNLVKAVGGGRWNPMGRSWEFAVAALPRILSSLKAEYDPEALRIAEKLTAERAALEAKIQAVRKVLQGKGRRPKHLRHLFEHQYKAFYAATQFDGYALFMETGTGKTLTAIEAIKHRRVKTLIVCPLSTIESVWMEELAKWAPGLKAVNLWRALKSGGVQPGKADVFVINFESFRKIPEDFFDEIGFLVVDESSRMKDHRSQITKAFLAAARVVPKRLILSGTPAPNSCLEYWAQMCFVNPDILGENFYVYRNTYFYPVGYGGFQYNCTAQNRERIMERVRRQACFFSKEDCLDLPEQVFEKRAYLMEPEQRKIYNTMLKLNIAELKDKTVLGSNELAKLMKLRQITSGFAITEDGSEADVSDGKLRLLMEVLEEIGPKQVITWCQFHWEIRKIKELLGDKAATIYGEVSQGEKEQAIRDFKEGKVQYLIAHPKSAGHGLTFVNCSYAVYFSLSYSLEEEKQSQDRIHRIGQKHKTTYLTLLAEDSIDEVIHRALRKKQDIAEAMLEMLKV